MASRIVTTARQANLLLKIVFWWNMAMSVRFQSATSVRSRKQNHNDHRQPCHGRIEARAQPSGNDITIGRI